VSQLIAFTNESGGVSLISGPDMDTLLQAAPSDAILIDSNALPSGPSEAWRIDGGAVVVDAARQAQAQQLANTAAIQNELDRRAQEKGYDNIVSACSYAAQEVGAPFQAEGAAFLQWRSAVWSQAYAVLAEVQAGNAPMPSPEEAVAMMPILSLPA
jgi:hypothetical protein